MTGVVRPMSNLLSRAGHPARPLVGIHPVSQDDSSDLADRVTYRLFTSWSTLNLGDSAKDLGSAFERCLDYDRMVTEQSTLRERGIGFHLTG